MSHGEEAMLDTFPVAVSLCIRGASNATNPAMLFVIRAHVVEIPRAHFGAAFNAFAVLAASHSWLNTSTCCAAKAACFVRNVSAGSSNDGAVNIAVLVVRLLCFCEKTFILSDPSERAELSGLEFHL